MVDYTDIQLAPKENEIDLISSLKTLWQGRRVLVICLVIFTLLGLFVALFSPVEYTAKTIMVPQIQSKTSNLGGLSSLAAMAGFNLDALQSGSSELSPIVYPQIVQSVPFQKSIMNTPITWQNVPQPVSLIDYYEKFYKPKPLEIVKKYTIGIPGLIIQYKNQDNSKSGLQNNAIDSFQTLTQRERKLQKYMARLLSLEVNSQDGYLTLTAIAPEAIAAAQIAKKAQKLLQDQVTEFKIDKARQNLIFVQELFSEKEKAFERSQSRLAQFRDRNLNLNSSMAKREEEKLQSEYQLAFSVYGEIAKQLENAKIRVKEDTPIFSIIEPVTIPLEKSKPRRVLILMIWFFLGGVFGICWIFGSHSLNDLRNKWKKAI